MGKSSSVTVGHKYLVGGHLVFCHGPIDSIDTIEWDTRAGWRGLATGGTITVDAENLFGGSKEASTTPGFGGGDNSDADGVSGEIDILMGGPTQPQNSYLQSVLGELIPAFRGVASFVLKQFYTGNSPTIRPLAAWGTRIHVKDDGQPQWYDEKAAIPYKHVNFEYDGLWKYKVVAPSGAGAPGLPAIYIIPSYDDSGWSEGSGGFGNVAPPGSTLAANTFVSSGTVGKAIWIRKKIVINKLGSTNLELDLYHDDGVWVWWNGEAIPTVQQVNYFHSKASIPNDKILASNVLVVQVLDGIPGGVATDIFAGVAIRDTGTAFSDINPAHFLRECYTSTVWGLKRPEYEMNDASFAVAADKLFDEGMGISLLWDRQQPINELIEEIKRHINADIYIDNEGLVTLKLIRDDYIYEDLPVYDESNIIRIERIASTPERELINAVTVVYWDAATGKDASVQIPHAALVQMTGRINPTTVRYDFFTNADIAIKKGEYDLRVITSSLQTYQVITNRSSEELNIGDRFILNRPALGAHNMVVRIIDIDLGNGVNNEISLTVTQEVFSLPSLPVMAASPDAKWENPVQPASPAPARLVFEQPYYELVQYKGQTEVDAMLAADNTLALLGVAAIRPTGTSQDAQVIVDDGAGYHEAEVLDYCPSALLATAMNYTTKNITFTDEIDLDLVSVGTHCQIDDELLVVEALDLVARTATLGRGVLDTVPAKEHLVGARIWFWDYYSASDAVTYSDGENVDVKILTNSSLGRLPTSSAPVNSIEFVGRAARPYPPGRLLINGSAYPASIGATDGLSLSWAHRDRLLQTAGTLQDTTVGDIGPEPGTTYRLRIYNQFMSLLRTVSAITGNAYDYATATEAADSGAGPSGTEEPFWKQTKLLLNFNGADNSTTFLDSSGEYADVFGNAKISTAESKFGGSSAYFDGAGDYLEFPSSSSFDLGTNYAIEFWYKPVSTGANAGLVTRGSYASLTWTGLAFSIRALGTGLRFYFYGTTYANEQYIDVASCLSAGVWVHIAMVRNGSSGAIYINGVSSGTIAGLNTPAASNQPLTVGRWNYALAYEYANGYMDDLRITKSTRYPSAFTPPAVQFGKYVRPDDFNQTVALFTAEPESTDPFYSSGEHVLNYAAENITSPNGYGGAEAMYFRAGIISTDSKFGARCFSDGYLFEQDEFNIHHTPDKKITIDFWGKIPSTMADSVFLHYFVRAYARWGICFIKNDGSDPVVMTFQRMDQSGAIEELVAISGTTTLDQWVHYAIVFELIDLGLDTAQVTIYRDGDQVGTGVVNYSDIAGVTEPRVGDDYPDYGIDMLFDEFRIRHGAAYTADFTPPASSIYPEDSFWANTPLLMNFNAANNSTAFENTGNISKLGTAVGNAKISTTQYKYGGSSGYFDGTGDYIYSNNSSRFEITSQNFTVEFWLRPDNLTGFKNIVRKSTGSNYAPFTIAQDGDKIRSRCSVNNTSWAMDQTSSIAITTGAWSHVALVRNGNVFTQYINGVASGTTTFSGSLMTNSSALYIAAASDGTAAYAGYLDDCRITIAARYTSNFTPPARELSRYLPALNSQLTFELESERDGLVSYQKHNVTVVRA